MRWTPAHLSLLIVTAVVLEFPPGAVSEAGTDDVILYGYNGLVAYVNKKGANIRVSRNVSDSNGHGFGNTGDFEVFLDTIEQVQENLEKINGPYKTSSFANIDFKIEALYNVSLPLSVSSGVYADCLNCSATLDKKPGTGAKISLAVCAINANATLDMNGELTNVTAGQLKVTFTVVDWPWYEVEASRPATDKLAVDIVIKCPPSHSVSEDETDSTGKPAKFSLGGDAFVEFSHVSYEDNADWKTMPDAYPKYTSNGANNHFTLILGHFSKSSVYDPNLEVGYLADSSDTQRITSQSSTVFAALLTVAVCGLFF